MMRHARSLLRQPVNRKVVFVLAPVVFFGAMYLGYGLVEAYLTR